MTTRSRKVLWGIVGAVVGVSATIWYWSHASRHVLTPQPWLSPDEAFTRDDRLDILEAVYRRMCQPLFPSTSAGRAPPSGGVWYFAVAASNDPPSELLQRLQDLPSRVKPVSLRTQRDSSIAGGATGKLEVTFVIRRAQMISRDEAQVEVVVERESDPVGSPHVHTVMRENGRWKVVEAKAK